MGLGVSRNSPPPLITSNHDYNSFIKARFYANYIKKQNFSFPDSVMYYVAKNPKSAHGYRKMVRSCKYFYVVNPIILCTTLTYKDSYGNAQSKDGNENEYNDDEADNEEMSDGDANDEEYIEAENPNDDNGSDIEDAAANKIDSSDVEKLNMWQIRYYCPPLGIDIQKVAAKFWISEEFYVTNMTDKDNLVTFIIPKIYRLEAKFVDLVHQNISFNDYVLLAANAWHIIFRGGMVKDNDGSAVAIEKLVEHAPKATKLYFFFDDTGTNISSKTVEKLLSIPRFLELHSFSLNNVPDLFDIDSFFAHIKQVKHTSVELSFSDSISDEYKARLGMLVDEIIGTDNRDYKTPLITYDGMDNEKLQLLYSLYLGFVRR